MPRDLQVIVTQTPCTRNFYSDGPDTMAQVEYRGDTPCPFYQVCPTVRASRMLRSSCVMAVGASVAVEAICTNASVAELVNEKLLPELVSQKPTAPTHYAWSADRTTLELIEKRGNEKRVLEHIRDFAVLVLEGYPDAESAYRSPSQRDELIEVDDLVVLHEQESKNRWWNFRK